MAEFRFMYQLDIARPSHQMGMIQLEVIIFRDATYLGMYKIKCEYRGKEYEYWTGRDNIKNKLNFKTLLNENILKKIETDLCLQ